jgi:hypothetical protein
MHTLVDLRGNLPVSVYLTSASVNDVKALDDLYIEPSAIYLMDRGYVDFNRLFKLITKKNAFFVTRAKDNMLFEVVSEAEVDKSTGIISDERIKLTGLHTAKWYPEELRMVTYEDYATSKVYRFLTNNMEYEALTISELYRERWNVELYFKWIKQHLHIKSFYGTSENAIYLQIWIAICKSVSLHQLLASSFIFLIIWINIDLFFAILPNGTEYSEAKWVVFIFGEVLPYVGDRLNDRNSIYSNIWDNQVYGGDQIAQGIWSLSSGGFGGQGLGQGNPNVVPAFHTDMIFTSIGEELGWIGLVLIILCFAILLHRTLLIGRRAGNPFALYFNNRNIYFIIE